MSDDKMYHVITENGGLAFTKTKQVGNSQQEIGIPREQAEAKVEEMNEGARELGVTPNYQIEEVPN